MLPGFWGQAPPGDRRESAKHADDFAHFCRPDYGGRVDDERLGVCLWGAAPVACSSAFLGCLADRLA